MTKKDKILWIIALIALTIKGIVFSLTSVLVYFIVIIPKYGSSCFISIVVVVQTVILSLFAWNIDGKEILQIFTLLLKDKIEKMENDDGRED